MASTLNKYIRMLEALKSNGFSLEPVENYFESTQSPTIYIRHDVDRMASRALKMAVAESNIGVFSTYYFRCTADSIFPERFIREIDDMGHRIGYHYEVFSRAGGDPKKAIELFRRDLESLRKIATIDTAAAHGAPLSAVSNMMGGQTIDMKEFDLLGEVYIDIDYNNVLYLSDSGGVFGSKHNLRDWSDGMNYTTPTKVENLAHVLKPQKYKFAVMGCHPERYPHNLIGFIQASATDNLINIAKTILKKVRK
jgi:hypothetical protein